MYFITFYVLTILVFQIAQHELKAKRSQGMERKLVGTDERWYNTGSPQNGTRQGRFDTVQTFTKLHFLPNKEVNVM